MSQLGAPHDPAPQVRHLSLINAAALVRWVLPTHPNKLWRALSLALPPASAARAVSKSMFLLAAGMPLSLAGVTWGPQQTLLPILGTFGSNMMRLRTAPPCSALDTLGPLCCLALLPQRHHAVCLYHWPFPICGPASPHLERLTLALTGQPSFPRPSSTARIALRSVPYPDSLTR